jgi:hypothetical protein
MLSFLMHEAINQGIWYESTAAALLLGVQGCYHSCVAYVPAFGICLSRAIRGWL